MSGPVGRRDPGSSTWVILGAGGHASSLDDVLRSSGQRVLAVSGRSQSAWNVRVLDSDESAAALAVAEGAFLALGIGDNALRVAVARSIQDQSLLRPAQSRSATCSDRAELGFGVAIFHHAHVGPGARLGDAVIVNTAAVVEHDVIVGEGSHIAPGACLLGGASVGSGTIVGSGARILPRVSVGDNVSVGAGAVVVDDVPSGSTVVGVPARPIEKIS